jgi:hypothetical protein
MPENTNFAELLSRLERVERSHSKWKRIGLLASIAALVLLILCTHAYSQKTTNPPAEKGNPPANGGAAGTPADERSMALTYTNFFRVTGTPEELIIDFGLNTQQESDGSGQVKLSNRMVMSFYTAKRLRNALQWSVTRYEDNFGEIETDYKKRMRPGAGTEKRDR